MILGRVSTSVIMMKLCIEYCKLSNRIIFCIV